METWTLCNTPFGRVDIYRDSKRWVIGTEYSTVKDEIKLFYQDGKITARFIRLNGQEKWNKTPSEMTRWLKVRGIDFNFKEFETKAIKKVESIAKWLEDEKRSEAERVDRVERLTAFHKELKALMEKYNVDCENYETVNCYDEFVEENPLDLFFAR